MVDFNMYVELSQIREGNENKHYRNTNEELPERMLIYRVTVKVPIAKDTKACVNLAIELKDVLMENECSVEVKDTKICFKVLRYSSDYYALVDEIYELKQEFTLKIEPVLEKWQVKECTVVFHMDMEF